MEILSPSSSSSMSAKFKGSTFDEFSMQQSLLFSNSLKDLKNLRTQLYSAAEYFELSYINDDQKQLVMNTLKDYAVKALVNTVDHLGSVSFKVNSLLDRKVDEVSSADLRVSCIEQRLRTCQEYIDGEGLSQQSLAISTPKYHKQYIIPVGASMLEWGKLAVAKYEESKPPPDDTNPMQFQTTVHSKIGDRPPSFRKTRAPSPSPRARSSSPLKLRSFSPSPRPRKNISTDKRGTSPLRTSNPLARSGSMSMSSRPPLLNSSSIGQRHPLESQRLSSMCLHAERTEIKDNEQNPSKSKSFLKSLLTRRRSRKDEMLYNYLDEY